MRLNVVGTLTWISFMLLMALSLVIPFHFWLLLCWMVVLPELVHVIMIRRKRRS